MIPCEGIFYQTEFTMKIEKNVVVDLDYTLRKDNQEGTVIEATKDSKPLVFIFGIGMMIPAFEENLEGKTTGDLVNFGIQAENAYGTHDAEAIMDVPIKYFEIDGKIEREKLVEGMPVNMQDTEGRMYTGVIQNQGIETITVDFNHPMAGQDLHFSVKINSVREATESELDHGHIHE
jgi:FKBP-type peptidyl-prolyl cis-trans isomerase SlyD